MVPLSEHERRESWKMPIYKCVTNSRRCNAKEDRANRNIERICPLIRRAKNLSHDPFLTLLTRNDLYPTVYIYRNISYVERTSCFYNDKINNLHVHEDISKRSEEVPSNADPRSPLISRLLYNRYYK